MLTRHERNKRRARIVRWARQWGPAVVDVDAVDEVDQLDEPAPFPDSLRASAARGGSR